MKIRSINVEKTYTLRQQILRPNHPLEACKFPEDKESSSAHFGCYISDELVGIISIFNVCEPGGVGNISGRTDWQIRAMATHESVRYRGCASQLLCSAEEYAQSRKGNLVWCNARTDAVGFYVKQGYMITGSEFIISGVGPHYRMIKRV